jgi:hypothetical protein
MNPGEDPSLAKQSRVDLQVELQVSCGNEYLADYARKYNSNVVVNPTTIDTVKHTQSIPIQYASTSPVRLNNGRGYNWLDGLALYVKVSFNIWPREFLVWCRPLA